LEEEEKVNRVARIILNMMRLEVLLGIALILWTLSLAAETNEYECPSSMDAIFAEQEKGRAKVDEHQRKAEARKKQKSIL
jgi:hypothetical protein